jgi:hypothetical protein
MKIQPLSKEIYNEAKALNVTRILLHFSGGYDEGILNVEIDHDENPASALEDKVLDWAWEVYSYSGAGDGHDYGDDIIYDIANNKAHSSSWYTVEQVDVDNVVEIALPID